MRITIKGEMTIADLRQAVFEALHQIEDDYAVAFSRGATIYINPTNELGEDVVVRTRDGRRVERIHRSGAYHCAADEWKP